MVARDEFPTCPRCKGGLDPTGKRLACKACQGVLVEERELSELVADMIGNVVSTFGWSGKVAEPQPLPLVARDAGEAVTCPRCATAMQAHALYGIEVDRCAAHGIWFDREELQDALQRAIAANRPHSTVGEKIYGGAFIAAYIAANILAFLFGA